MIKNALIGQKAERDAFLKGNYVPREGVPSAKAALAKSLEWNRTDRDVYDLPAGLISDFKQMAPGLFLLTGG